MAALDDRALYEPPNRASRVSYSTVRPISSIADSTCDLREDLSQASSRCFTTKEAVTNLTGEGPSHLPSRPLSAFLNTLVDAAHFKQATRCLQHPKTPAYTVWEWRAQDTARSSRHMARASTARGNRASEQGWEQLYSHTSRAASSAGAPSTSISWNFQEETCASNPDLEVFIYNTINIFKNCCHCYNRPVNLPLCCPKEVH